MSEQEIKDVITKTELLDIEIISIIQEFIFEKKGVNVKINRPVGAMFIINMQPYVDLDLMDKMYNVCFSYYWDKFKL